MQYLLLIYSDENIWSDEESQRCLVDSMAISNTLTSEGKLITGLPLHPVSTATSVRVRHGKRYITDGPFAETTEQLGGFYLLDVENLDEAIRIAEQLPPVNKGTVEIRPILPLPE